jgi:hypothetical protein
MRLLWTYYLLALIVITVIFALRTASFYDLIKKGRLKFNLATDNAKRHEIRNRTKEALTDMLCWLGVTLLSFFAVVDCFIKVIEGWDF